MLIEAAKSETVRNLLAYLVRRAVRSPEFKRQFRSRHPDVTLDYVRVISPVLVALHTLAKKGGGRTNKLNYEIPS